MQMCRFTAPRLLGMALLFLLTLAAHAAPLTRWAMLTTGEQAATVGDLATAELAGVPGIELVERDLLAKTTAEQALTALSAEGTSDRLRLGEILNADALVLLQQVPGDLPTLRLVVAECRGGVRLRVETLPLSAEKTPELAAHVRELVKDLQRQYANGITRVIGVPDFVSRSFSHEFDSLQTRYSELLQNVLLLEPGVAVIETTEAQAIGRELAIGGHGLIALPVPVFVQGEFRVEPQPNADPTITFTVKLADAARTLDTLTSDPLPLGGAAGWLSTNIPAKVLAGAAHGTPLTQAEQAKALAALGDTFAQLDNFEQSTQLRESSLLLAPDLPKVRYALVEQYYKYWVYREIYQIPIYTQGPTPPEVLEDYTQFHRCYTQMLNHVEYAITHEQWTHDEVISSLSNVNGITLMMSLSVARHYPPNGTNHLYQGQAISPDVRALLADAEQAKRRCIRAIWSAINRRARQQPLDYAPGGPVEQYWCQQNKLIEILKWDMQDGRITADDLKVMQQFFAEFYPDNYLMPILFTYYAYPDIYAPDLQETAYLEFIFELQRSPNRMAKAYAEAALLTRRLVQATAKGDQAEQDTARAALNALAQSLDAMRPPVKLADQTRGSGVLLNLKLLAGRAQQHLPPVKIAEDDTGALHFEKIEVELHTIPSFESPEATVTPFTSGGIRDQWLNCGTFDVVVHGYQLLFHRKPGVLEMVPLPIIGPNMWPSGPVWDGRSVWVASPEQEIWAFSSDGKLQMRVTPKHGLPPVRSRFITLYAIAPGRILAVASTAEQRAWCGIVEWAGPGTTPTVKVFLESTRFPLTGELQDPAAKHRYMRDPKAGFRPSYINRIDVPGGHHTVAVWRDQDAPGIGGLIDSLLIDLDALTVSSCPLPQPEQRFSVFRPLIVTRQGRLVGMIGYDMLAIADWMPEKGLAPHLDNALLENPGARNPKEDWIPPAVIAIQGNMSSMQLDDWWYLACDQYWYRLNLTTGKAQRLNRTPLPVAFADETTVVVNSALLGPIISNRNGVYRVTIDETKIPQAEH